MKIFDLLILPLLICASPLLVFLFIAQLKLMKGYNISLTLIGVILIAIGIVTPIYAIGVYQKAEKYYCTVKIICSSGSSLFFWAGYGATFSIIGLIHEYNKKYEIKYPSEITEEEINEKNRANDFKQEYGSFDWSKIFKRKR